MSINFFPSLRTKISDATLEKEFVLEQKYMNTINRHLHVRFPFRTNAILQFSQCCLGRGEIFLRLKGDRREIYSKICDEVIKKGDDFWTDFVRANCKGDQQAAEFIAEQFPQFAEVARSREEGLGWWDRIVLYVWGDVRRA